MKLFEFIESIKDKMSKDDIYCIVNNKLNPIIIYAIYKHNKTNQIMVYFNAVHSNTIDELSDHYKMLDINMENIIIVKRNNWSNFLKKTIKNGFKDDKFVNELKSDITKNGGKIVYIKDEPYILIGVSSTDEDYYYILVKADDEYKNAMLRFSSCCCKLTFKDNDYLTIKENNLCLFVNENKAKIIDQLNSLTNDVIIRINFGDNKNHFKNHENNALDIILNKYKKYYNNITEESNLIILGKILNKINNDFINSKIIILLNEYIREYENFYIPLDTKYKNYYQDYFRTKLDNILNKHLNKIDNSEVKSYVFAVCRTIDKILFNKN